MFHWIKELLSTPAAWVQWQGIEGQADNYIPIVIADAKVITRKLEERYMYEIQIEYKLSNSPL